MPDTSTCSSLSKTTKQTTNLEVSPLLTEPCMFFRHIKAGDLARFVIMPGTYSKRLIGQALDNSSVEDLENPWNLYALIVFGR